VNILVIDDEQGIRDLLSVELGSHGYQVVVAGNGEEALDTIRRRHFDLVITDVKMPKLGGLETLEAIKEIDPDTEVILATGFGTIDTAVAAMKKGAYDFIQKPFNLNEILALIEKALEKSELKALLGIYQASKAVFASTKVEKLLPLISDLSLKVLKADDVYLYLSDVSSGPRLAARSGGTDPVDPSIQLLASAVEKKSDSLISVSEASIAEFIKSNNSGSTIALPIRVKSETLGVLLAHRKTGKGKFGGGDLRNAMIFGSQIAQAVFNARLYQSLEEKIEELRVANEKLTDTQHQLIRSEKMAAVGQLAAGVAHELNNPLTGILGFAQLLMQSSDLSGREREDLESIHVESQRCRQIIQNLLKFSRRKEPLKAPIEIVQLLDSTLDLVYYEVSTSGIEVIKEYIPSAPPIFGDSAQLQQVFVNIVTNAKQAMEERGTGELRIKVEADPTHLRVLFKDNGCGIAKQNLSKIFDPFFTTKPVGKGTGLGLSVSYGIIESHGGAVRVESEEGVGTTVTVELPVYQSAPATDGSVTPAK